ncbi:branched-chain amino acid aminotransferase [Sphingomonas sabuli]|uniref:Branched-chain-amino-acid aminotransferase n=1 Tax=Sphingomonas sabuli TaxID=2764186 RepID=A0A7G9L489_9SPHN|nr:branched-chain amino acid aminotransferase [Sphingomonas sabuli]QNM83438.1 branched-chain amino acid aminotransferase [Sphingomonas sabuli]
MADTQTFHDRDGSIWFDGKLVPWRDAEVHVLTHALHYASSVFEGQRAYNGKIFKLTEHSMRLRKSAELLGFEIPYTVEELNAASEEVLAASGLTDAYMRPIAWLGSEKMGVSATGAKVHVAIAAWEWGKYFDEEKAKKGIRLTIAPWRRPAPYTAPVHSKASGLYMIASLSRKHAEDTGFDDALMFDWRGQVAEATGANAFFIRDGVLHTPTPDCFLDGITRRTVMDLARKRGVEVQERTIWPDELESFEQMFLTGSAAEVTPVGSVGPWSFEVGDLTRQLAKDYDDLVNGRIPNA